MPDGTTGLTQPYWLKFANFSQLPPSPLYLVPSIGGDPFQINGKALLILKLESSMQLMVKIW